MVGVPGRSKGCNTCRQRRVKCSEEKPFCNRCEKAGFTCLGYAREIQWHHLSSGPFRSQNTTQVALRSRATGRVHEPVKPASAKKLKVAARSGSQQPQPICIPAQISLNAFEDDFCFAYIFSNFVWRGYGASWLRQSAQGHLGQLALDSAKSLAETNFGKSQNMRRIEMKGRMKYGKVLRDLIQKLGSGQDETLQDLIIPILVLLMHVTTLTDKAAATFHLQGITQILTISGPQAFQPLPLREAFEASRATIVVASLLMRKRVFLDDPAWCSVPYAQDPISKPPQSYLMDILTSVPGMLEDHSKLQDLQDKLTSTPHEGVGLGTAQARGDSFWDMSMRRTEILMQVEKKLTSIFIWRWRWQRTHGSDVSAGSEGRNWQNHRPGHKLPSNAPSSRPETLEFSRPGAAADIALYNAVLMWLLALVWDLEPIAAESIIEKCSNQALDVVLSDTDSLFVCHANNTFEIGRSTSFQPLKHPGATTQVRDAAMEICRIFEWQSRNYNAAWETNVAYMFPIGLALCVLDTETENRSWIRAMLDADTFTRNYGSCGEAERNACQASRSVCSLKEDGTMVVQDQRAILRLQDFATYVTQELVGTGVKRTGSAQSSHLGTDSGHPGLVHLLLLRGCMDVNTKPVCWNTTTENNGPAGNCSRSCKRLVAGR